MIEFEQGFYKNNKTGNIYFAECLLINSTNANEGQLMVEYYIYENKEVLFNCGYVREYSEFMEKFTKINIE